MSDGRAGPVPAPRSFLVRRLLPLAVLAGAAAWFFESAPREVTLVYRFASGQAEIRGMSVELLQLPDRLTARRADFSFGARAPDELLHPVRLLKGRHELAVTLKRRGPEGGAAADSGSDPVQRGLPERLERVTRTIDVGDQDRIEIALP